MEIRLRTVAALLFVSAYPVAFPAKAATEVSLLMADASFLGEAAGDQAGFAVARAGDVNADGYADFLIGAPYNDEGGVDAGQVYLILGGPFGWVSDIYLHDADASFVGEQAGDAAGYAVAGGGDLNGDGFDDLVLGAPYNDDAGTDGGKAYVLFGHAYGWSTDTALSAADSRLLAEAYDNLAGYSVAIASDVNGDAVDDLMIGAPWGRIGADHVGKVYVLFGGAEAWSSEMPLADVGVSFVGEYEYDNAGAAGAGIGDSNGDGYGDLVIGAPAFTSGTMNGKTYIVLGGVSGWSTDQPLASSDSSFLGEDAGDMSGWTVSGGHDLDADGTTDLLIGAPHDADYGSTGAGHVYLERGSLAGWSPGADLSSSDASVFPESGIEELGWFVSGAGDYNGDGVDDFLVGSPMNCAGCVGPGGVRLFLGGAVLWAMHGSATNAYTRFTGEQDDDAAGYSGTGAGDVDGDLADDLLIGAPLNDQSGTEAGKAYLVFGVPCSGADDDADGWTDCQGDCDDADPVLHNSDMDGDGFTPCGGDCDDTNSGVFPDAPELCDGVSDNDCDGNETVWDVDQDGDGWTWCAGDCDDTDASVHPDDLDADGFSPCDGDCDDGSAEVSPDALEVCDGLDTDCDGEIPPDESDSDADGVSVCDGDCDDQDDSVHPAAVEVCDGTDNDCDGVSDDVDADGDGYLAGECGGSDCDDSDFLIHPDAPESCADGLDNDCDGAVDGLDADCEEDGQDDDDVQDPSSDDDSQDDSGPRTTEQSCECSSQMVVPEPRTLLSLLTLLAIHLALRRRSRCLPVRDQDEAIAVRTDE